VHDALRLAVRSALAAAKGELLPLALTSGTATWVNPEDPSSSGSSGWAAAGGSRLEAALSAAGVNMKLRARVSGGPCVWEAGGQGWGLASNPFKTSHGPANTRLTQVCSSSLIM
jgi:hypothetical protein